MYTNTEVSAAGGNNLRRPRQQVLYVNPQAVDQLKRQLFHMKNDELKALCQHLRLIKTGIKADLVDRLVQAVQLFPETYYPHIRIYCQTRDLPPFQSSPPIQRPRAPRQRRSPTPRTRNPQPTYSYKPTNYNNGYVQPAQQPVASKEAYKLAAEYLDVLANNDPFVSRKATVLRVQIFKMPQLYTSFEVSDSVMSMIRTGQCCRFNCLELTSDMDKNNLHHSWPTNATLTINRSQVGLIQKQVQEGKVKNKSIRERPANIQNLIQPGTNTFRLTGEPNLKKGDWPYGVCITIVQAKPMSVIVGSVIEANSWRVQDTLDKIKTIYEEDSEVVTEKMSVSLKCPLTLARLQTPARGRNCTHIACFELETFLAYQRDAKNASWKCLICEKETLNLRSIIIDEWFEEVLEYCKDFEDVDYIDVYADGSFTLITNDEVANANDRISIKGQGRKRRREEKETNTANDNSTIKEEASEPVKADQVNPKEEEGILKNESFPDTSDNGDALVDCLNLGSSFDTAIEL